MSRSAWQASRRTRPRKSASPAVLKPTIGGGSANAFIVRTQKELKTLTPYLPEIMKRLVGQEYAGTPNDEFTVGVLHGRDGAFLKFHRRQRER